MVHKALAIGWITKKISNKISVSDEIGININQKHTTICIMHKNKRKYKGNKEDKICRIT